MKTNNLLRANYEPSFSETKKYLILIGATLTGNMFAAPILEPGAIIDNIKPLSIEQIYNDLSGKYRKYNGITYAKPTINSLPNNWFIQTPNIWGTTLAVYNNSLIPSEGDTTDSQFFVPTCSVSQQCNGVAICKKPAYTLDSRKLCVGRF